MLKLTFLLVITTAVAYVQVSVPLSTETVDAIKQQGNCLLSKGFTDKTLGTVDTEASLYCNPLTPTTLRLIPGLTCCTPQTPDEMKVQFQLHKPGKPMVSLNWRDANEVSKLCPGRVTFVAHGYLESADISGGDYMQKIKQGILAKGEQVILVNWEHANAIQYFQAAANVRVVGMMIGHMIVSWGIACRTRMIGHSLGGQMVGEVGKFVKKNGNGRMVAECIATDAAGPGFDGGHEDMRTTKDDCALVQSIHSSAAETSLPVGAIAALLGTMHKGGHCDWWVNCGHYQPTCATSDIPFKDLLVAASGLANGSADNLKQFIANRLCSHNRAPLTLASSIQGKCNYQTTKCTKCGTAAPGNTCTGSGAGPAYPVAQGCTASMDADFIIKSSDIDPYC